MSMIADDARRLAELLRLMVGRVPVDGRDVRKQIHELRRHADDVSGSDADLIKTLCRGAAGALRSPPVVQGNSIEGPIHVTPGSAIYARTENDGTPSAEAIARGLDSLAARLDDADGGEGMYVSHREAAELIGDGLSKGTVTGWARANPEQIRKDARGKVHALDVVRFYASRREASVNEAEVCDRIAAIRRQKTAQR